MRTLVTVCLLSLAFCACSPAYIMRAGWEEASILWRREPIDDLLKDQALEAGLKAKLMLTADVRLYSETLGLKPEKSFTYYSEVDREELVWVVNAAHQDSLSPKTWWFPVVGTIQYKGFFAKTDALEMAEQLKADGFDTYVRPSAAFSTLGWFNDPLLSTVAKFSDVELTDTIIHELFHNTVWIKNNTAINESLANFFGAKGTILYFEQKYGVNHALSIEARDSFQDELVFSDFINKTYDNAKAMYADCVARYAEKNELDKKTSIRADKERFYAQVQQDFEQLKPQFQSARYQKLTLRLNNASLLALRFYLRSLNAINATYNRCGSYQNLLMQIKALEHKHFDSEDGPFSELGNICPTQQ